MDVDILITNGRILAGNPENGGLVFVEGNYLAIKDGLISRIDQMRKLPPSLKAATILDAGGGLVMPGLVNGHCHAAMTLFRGLADDLPLMTWLHDHIFPAEAEFVSREMVYWCSKLAAVEMISSGTTTVADSYFFEGVAAKAFAEVGIRSVAAQGVIDFPAPGVPDPLKNVEAAAAYLDEWQGKDDLVLPAIFCHSPYTCSPATIKKAKELAIDRGVPFFIHVAETQAECAQIREEYGLSPVRHLFDLGVLDGQTSCVHCIWLDEDDIDILAATGAKVVTCPESNMKLAAGVAPVPAMLGKGVSLALGTDGCASNNDLDMFGEMDSLAKLHKVNSMDPTVLAAPQVLAVATAGLAGRLTSGSVADLIIVDLNQPHFVPLYSPDLLVYGARGADVRDVIVGGKLLYKNRNFISLDLGEVLAKVTELAKPLKNR